VALTKFVGRERELTEMRRTLALTLAGHGQIVAVVAEAGIGKSRLFHEFKAMLQSDCKVLEAYSVSHGKASAWLPVIELLRSYFAIQNHDEPPARREKLRTSPCSRAISTRRQWVASIPSAPIAAESRIRVLASGTRSK
jgi:predicted ATPase